MLDSPDAGVEGSAAEAESSFVLVVASPAHSAVAVRRAGDGVDHLSTGSSSLSSKTLPVNSSHRVI